MSLAVQEGKNCLCASSNKLFMQHSDLPFACLRIIVHSIFQLLDRFWRLMLALMKAQSCIFFRRTSFCQATLKAYRLDQLFNPVFALMHTKSLHQQAYLCLLL